jgi:hypothetical protein
MKKILIIFTVCILSSCASLMPSTESTAFIMPSGIYNAEQAWTWVADNIRYKSDDSNLYHIQTPQETLNKGWGDCKAYSVLLAAMLYQLGYDDVAIVYGYKSDGGRHAIVAAKILTNMQGCDLVEPQTYGWYMTSKYFKEDSRMTYATYKMLVDGGWTSY